MDVRLSVLVRRQGLTEAPGVDPPEVMDHAVDEDDGDLLGIAVRELRVVEDRNLRPLHSGVGADGSHDSPRVIAEVTARLAHEDHPLFGHPPSLAE